MTTRASWSAEVVDVGLFGAMPRYGDMAMHAVLDLSRTFPEGDVARAFERTLRDFPVLGCRYRPGVLRDRWVRSDDGRAVVQETVPADRLETRTMRWVEQPLDPTREPVCRLLALRTDKGMRLVLTLSHLAVDGAGIAAVGHVLGAHLYGRAPRVPVEPRRDLLRVLDGLRPWHLPALGLSLAREALRPLFQLGAGPRTRDYPRDPRAPARSRQLAIPSGALARLRERTGRATVNDLLIGALARVAGRRSDRGPVLVTYTMDLRRYGSAPRLSASNSSSILCAIVPRDRVTDLAGTVGAVRELTRSQVRDLRGPAFLLAPYALGAAVPHALARGVVRKLSPALVDLPLERGFLMTNVGRVDEGLSDFGDDIEEIRFVGPSIKGVPVPVVVAFGYRGELRLQIFAGPGLGDALLDELCGDLRWAFELEPEELVARW